MKKIFKIIVFVFVFVLLFSVAGCDKCNDTPSQEEPGKKVIISLSQTQLELELYEEIVISATVRNSEEDVVWSSNNPEVCSVAEGKLTALAAGNAVISAGIGNVSATCSVTVTDNGAKPYIYVADGLTELTKAAGEEFSLPVSVMFNGKETDCTLDFSSSDSSVISVDGNKLTAERAGVAVITVSGEYIGNEVLKIFTITVLETD